MTFILILILIILFVAIFKAPISRTESLKKRENVINSATSIQRGTPSERSIISDMLSVGINPNAIFHDLYFGIGHNEYTQVDLIIATHVGIIVIEAKDYSGWIYGDSNQKYWTQVLAYGKEKHRFYNPIMQNASHINGIKAHLLQFQNIPFFSIIVFDGDCRLREINNIPPNTYVIYASQLTQVINHILTHNKPAPYTNKQAIVNLFQSASKNGTDIQIVQTHIDNIKKRHPYNSHHHKYTI